MQNGGVFIDLVWHGWITSLNDFFGSTAVLECIILGQTIDMGAMVRT